MHVCRIPASCGLMRQPQALYYSEETGTTSAANGRACTPHLAELGCHSPSAAAPKPDSERGQAVLRETHNPFLIIWHFVPPPLYVSCGSTRPGLAALRLRYPAFLDQLPLLIKEGNTTC